MGISTSVNLNVRNQTFTRGDAGKTALFHILFPRALEIAQPKLAKGPAADGTSRTPTRIDRTCRGLRHPDEPFDALADFKLISVKARKRAHHELLRNTPSSPSAKLMIAATAMRACRNRYLGTSIHCCAAWQPSGQCFGRNSSEWSNFHGFCQIIANLTRERIEREAAVQNLPWTQMENDDASAKCRLNTSMGF